MRRRAGARRPPDRLRLVGHRPGTPPRSNAAGPTSTPDRALTFIQFNILTAGLTEGVADVSVLRRPISDARLRTALLGVEQRYAAVAADDALPRRSSSSVNDFTGRTVAIDDLTGTTTEELRSSPAAPATTQTVRGVDDWLTLIAAGPALGMTAEATAAQHPRPGVVYRPVRDAQPIPVWLAWWALSPPSNLDALRQLNSEQYTRRPPQAR